MLKLLLLFLLINILSIILPTTDIDPHPRHSAKQIQADPFHFIPFSKCENLSSPFLDKKVLHSAIDDALNCKVIVSEFELQSRYCVHF